MADLNRRNFLFGTVAAAAAGTALTIVGKDVELFKPTLNEIVSINRVKPEQMAAPRKPYYIEPCMPGDILYNDKGEPICVVQSMNLETSVMDVTRWGDPEVRYIGGPLKQVAMEVELINPYL